MKDQDYKMLEEAYSQVINEAIYSQEVIQAMKKAQQLLSTKQPVDTATQSIIAQDPRACFTLVKMAVESGFTSNLERLFGEDIWNSIKSENLLSRELEGWLNKHNISIMSLYGEAHDLPPFKGKGEEWHGLGAKMPEGPSMADLVKFRPNKKEMQDLNLGGGMKKSMPVHSLANSIIDALDEHGDNYKDFAIAIAMVFKNEYESQHLPADKFLKAIEVALKLGI